MDFKRGQQGFLLFFLALLALLTACNNAVQKTSPNKTKLFGIPQALQSNALPTTCTDNLTAWLSVDGGDTTPLIIKDKQLAIPLDGITLGGHVFELEFRCLVEGEQLVLVKGVKSHQLTRAEDPVIFNEEDYLASIDTDNDSVSNITELELGYNPLIANNPEVPEITVDVDIKQLRFSWQATLFTDYYILLKSTDAGQNFSAVVADNITMLNYTEEIAVHRQEWLNSRYKIQSCNSTGCTDSIPISASDKMLQSIAYIKASNTNSADYFGRSVAVSADGSTLAVGAPVEGSDANGVNDDTLVGQADNSAWGAGAVYVFTHTGNTWQQQAYIKASNTGPGDSFGSSVALSADGNTLAVGAPVEGSAATGVNDTLVGQANDSARGAGAVYVFTRVDTVWQQQAYIKASNTDSWDEFGGVVSLSADGNTLAVGADAEDSVINVVNAPLMSQMDNSADYAGAVYIFTRVDTTWQQQAYIKASNAEVGDQFGWSVALSGDGNTLAVGAPFEDSAAAGVNNTFVEQADNSASAAGAVYVFTRSNSTWQQQAYIKASTTDISDQFGWSVSLSIDGNTLAVGAPKEDSAARGVNDTLTGQANNVDAEAGAAYVFARVNSSWQQQAYVKASNTDAGDLFGSSVALSSDGNTLAVGANIEASTALGVNDSIIGQPDNTSPGAGAVYVFNRFSGAWQQQAYVKASNTEMADYFGGSVALSSDGNTLVIGAHLEDSAAVGINDTTIGQVDYNASNSGAVYLY